MKLNTARSALETIGNTIAVVTGLNQFTYLSEQNVFIVKNISETNESEI